MDAVIDRGGLDALIAALRDDGYTVVGPTVRAGTIVDREIRGVGDLPAGWTDEQGPGTYRLTPGEDASLFAHGPRPQSLKPFLFPPRTLVVRSRRTADGFEPATPRDDAPRHAFVGARPCDLAAVAVQDRVFIDGDHPDPAYRARRDAFVVAVDCGHPAATCFCTSMGGGPRATDGFDIALTEIDGTGDGRMVARTGSARGEELLRRVPHRAADAADCASARQVTDDAAASITRRVDTDGLPGILTGAPTAGRWDEVAERCIACGNCTMVCPTCFCSAVEDVTDLRGGEAERWRRWDSCFTLDFSYLHGGSVRRSVASRYRQWLTHKLATWHDQFGTTGCVGCGRCITWCPVGIDITEEVAAHRAAATG